MVVDNLPPIGGNAPIDCPEYVQGPCWEPCKHVTETLKNYYNFENYSQETRHFAIAESLLQRQDDFIQELCGFSLDNCTKGLLIGFPCVQCGYICDTGLCGTEPLCPGYVTICNITNCDLFCEVDYNSTPELQELYGRIVGAFWGKTYQSGTVGVKQVADSIFGSISEVVKIENHTYYLYPGRALTEVEVKSWFIIKKLLPVPFGFSVNLVGLENG